MFSSSSTACHVGHSAVNDIFSNEPLYHKTCDINKYLSIQCTSNGSTGITTGKHVHKMNICIFCIGVYKHVQLLLLQHSVTWLHCLLAYMLMDVLTCINMSMPAMSMHYTSDALSSVTTESRIHVDKHYSLRMISGITSWSYDIKSLDTVYNDGEVSYFHCVDCCNRMINQFF